MQCAGSSSLIRVQTQTPCIGSRVLATGPPGRSQHVAFCGWLLSLSTFSEFIPIVTCVSASFLFMAESSSIVWLDHISYTHSSTVGDLGSSHFPSLVNVCLRAVFPFSWACPRGRVAGSHRGSSCNHLSHSRLASAVVTPPVFSPTVYRLPSTSSPTLDILHVFSPQPF